jgi:hypothetical protein
VAGFADPEAGTRQRGEDRPVVRKTLKRLAQILELAVDYGFHELLGLDPVDVSQSTAADGP